MIETEEYYGGTYPEQDYEEYKEKEEYDYADEYYEQSKLGLI